MKNLSTSNPNAHIQNISKELQGVKEHLRRDISKVSDPQAKALFETSAEVIEGIITAFSDYQKKDEEAWKRTNSNSGG